MDRPGTRFEPGGKMLVLKSRQLLVVILAASATISLYLGYRSIMDNSAHEKRIPPIPASIQQAEDRMKHHLHLVNAGVRDREANDPVVTTLSRAMPNVRQSTPTTVSHTRSHDEAMQEKMRMFGIPPKYWNQFTAYIIEKGYKVPDFKALEQLEKQREDESKNATKMQPVVKASVAGEMRELIATDPRHFGALQDYRKMKEAKWGPLVANGTDAAGSEETTQLEYPRQIGLNTTEKVKTCENIENMFDGVMPRINPPFPSSLECDQWHNWAQSIRSCLFHRLEATPERGQNLSTTWSELTCCTRTFNRLSGMKQFKYEKPDLNATQPTVPPYGEHSMLMMAPPQIPPANQNRDSSSGSANQDEDDEREIAAASFVSFPLNTKSPCHVAVVGMSYENHVEAQLTRALPQCQFHILERWPYAKTEEFVTDGRGAAELFVLHEPVLGELFNATAKTEALSEEELVDIRNFLTDALPLEVDYVFISLSALRWADIEDLLLRTNFSALKTVMCHLNIRIWRENMAKTETVIEALKHVVQHSPYIPLRFVETEHEILIHLLNVDSRFCLIQFHYQFCEEE